MPMAVQGGVWFGTLGYLVHRIGINCQGAGLSGTRLVACTREHGRAELRASHLTRLHLCVYCMHVLTPPG